MMPPGAILWGRMPDAQALQVIGAVRCIRLLRLRRIVQFFRHREAELNARIIILRLFKFTILVATSCHLAACVWSVVACPPGRCLSNSWWAAASEGVEANTTTAFVRVSTRR